MTGTVVSAAHSPCVSTVEFVAPPALGRARLVARPVARPAARLHARGRSSGGGRGIRRGYQVSTNGMARHAGGPAYSGPQMMMPKKTAHMSTIHCMPWSQSRTVRVSPSEILRATNLSTSSSSTTGTENFITVTHSSSDSGVTWNTACVHNHVKEIHSMITRNQ